MDKGEVVSRVEVWDDERQSLPRKQLNLAAYMGIEERVPLGRRAGAIQCRRVYRAQGLPASLNSPRIDDRLSLSKSDGSMESVIREDSLYSLAALGAGMVTCFLLRLDLLGDALAASGTLSSSSSSLSDSSSSNSSSSIWCACSADRSFRVLRMS